MNKCKYKYFHAINIHAMKSWIANQCQIVKHSINVMR